MLAALLVLPALAAPQGAPAPPQLTALDLAFGTSSGAADHLGLVPGHTVEFAVVDPAGPGPGQVAVLAASTGLAATPLPLGPGATLLLEPSGAIVLGVKPFGGSLEARFQVEIPSGLPLGAPLATQAATLDPGALALETTWNALTHTITDLTPVVVGSFDQTGYPIGPIATAIVIEAPRDLDSFWDLHTFGSGAPQPVVDFDTQVLVVAFGGEQTSGGYALAVDALQPGANGHLEVLQTLTTPGAGCPTTDGFTHPGQLVTVDRVAAAPPPTVRTTPVAGPPCP